MKKIFLMLSLILLILLAVPFPAQADVIAIPMDAFFDSHFEECEYHSRSYTAAGPNGAVTVYESPESSRKEKTISNGETLWISYIYKDSDGIQWGCYENWEEDITGWVPMDYLEVIYDGVSFEEEYGSEFQAVDYALDGEELTGKTVYFWEYPGSSNYVDLVLDAGYLPEFQTEYTDANGNRWARCGYYMGIRGYWINLNDPTADYAEPIIPVPDETEGPAIPETEEPVAEIVPKENTAVKLAAIGAVAVTVAVTAVLLCLLKKKKQ